eukprot:scaffold371855_cov48-Prasinocladus_malaysianus.AAC.1
MHSVRDSLIVKLIRDKNQRIFSLTVVKIYVEVAYTAFGTSDTHPAVCTATQPSERSRIDTENTQTSPRYKNHIAGNGSFLYLRHFRRIV